ncbi:YfaP family protein [Flavobacterium sp. LC2016-12]|uniref:YfaP family protein n=1 Tax=Flavobacterium sp. LC2016-12 TaxID=2783794 RepID=UPI00188AF6CC|nr:hypothetical protein [Flavobacterium sp. LC2016-12]MBF4466844.1 hypothetical protein [Flavobacterium sp. LC2016-12]
MKKTLQKAILLCVLSVGVLGCSSEGGDEDIPVIEEANDYVTDAPSLMEKMTISGAVLKSGDIPVPAGEHSDNIASIPNTIIVTSNSLFTIPIGANTTEDRIPRIMFIKLKGSSKYYQIDLDTNGNPVNANARKASTALSAPIRLSCSGHPNIELPAKGAGYEAPSYTNEAEVYVYSPPLQSPQDLSFLSQPRYWSQPRIINFKVLDVGTGDLQVSLTWDTQSDVDLWLTEPNGNKIYYANDISSTGGELDFDNTLEYGPENIFYKNTAPSGTYKVEVNYFSGAPLYTHYNLVIKNGNKITSYEGTLSSYDQIDEVAVFSK